MAKSKTVHLDEVKTAVTPIKKFLVSLRSVPSLTVEAVSRDDAWTKYRNHFGIRDSEYLPEVQEVNE